MEQIRQRNKQFEDKMYCRSFYVRKDGTMYVQAGHDKVHQTFQNTIGKEVRVPLAGNKFIVGIHRDTKKCGIILTDWQIYTRA